MSSAPSITQPHSLSFLSGTLTESRPLSPEVRLLTFQVPERPKLDFLAGQSVRLALPMNGKTVQLAYSIASPPVEGNRFELCVRAGKKGSPTDFLCALSAGAQIRFSPPQGSFVLRQPEEDTLFLAAGTGIAPIRSMIHWLLRKNGRHPVLLLYGARDAESLFFHSEFLALADRLSRFRYLPVLSRPREGWPGARGHVHHHLDGIIPATRAYVCGPPAMVKNAASSLAELGWPGSHIHYDDDGR